MRVPGWRKKNAQSARIPRRKTLRATGRYLLRTEANSIPCVGFYSLFSGGNAYGTGDQREPAVHAMLFAPVRSICIPRHIPRTGTFAAASKSVSLIPPSCSIPSRNAPTPGRTMPSAAAISAGLKISSGRHPIFPARGRHSAYFPGHNQ